MHETRTACRSFRRVRDLLRSGAVAPEFEKSLANFEATVDRLTELAAQQDVQGRLTLAATQRARLLALRLRTEMMKPVVRIGRSFLPRTGEEAEPIRRALALRPASDYEGLLAAAEGMARLVQQHEGQFTQAGLPAGHVKMLLQVSNDLRLAIDGRGQEMARRTAATSGARQATSDAMRQLRILASLILPRSQGNAEWMAAWRTATVIARTGARGSDTGELPATGTPTDDPITTPTPEAKAA